MFRTEIYLKEEQRAQLHDVSFLLTKKKKKRIGMAEVIREAIDEWLQKHFKKRDETDLILNSPILMEGIRKARVNLKQGKILSRKEIF